MTSDETAVPLTASLSTTPEHLWRVALSLAISITAGALFLYFWIPAMIGLWDLATFEITGPIRPMGLAAYLVFSGIVGWFVCCPLSLLALRLSNRTAAVTAAALVAQTAILPVVGFLLMILVVLFRGLELKD